MHNLALALQLKGYEVTGSDDAIYDPAKTNLEKAGLLRYFSWNPAVCEISFYACSRIALKI